MKNCGDYVHFQIAEKKILEEMIKIVRKKVSLIHVNRMDGLWISCNQLLAATVLKSSNCARRKTFERNLDMVLWIFVYVHVRALIVGN